MLIASRLSEVALLSLDTLGMIGSIGWYIYTTNLRTS